MWACVKHIKIIKKIHQIRVHANNIVCMDIMWIWMGYTMENNILHENYVLTSFSTRFIIMENVFDENMFSFFFFLHL